MSKMGIGYGSEWHLLRYLGYHREELSKHVMRSSGAAAVRWLDFPSSPSGKRLDGECKGLDFLTDRRIKSLWATFWPQTGNVPNWDAVGEAQMGQGKEWLLVEAKAHVGELRTSCGATSPRSLRKIAAALDAAKANVGAPASANWLQGYYQYANRLATLHFLVKHKVPARLVFIYFLGDRHTGKRCPRSQSSWHKMISKVARHLGLTGTSSLEKRVHKCFLPVRP